MVDRKIIDGGKCAEKIAGTLRKKFRKALDNRGILWYYNTNEKAWRRPNRPGFKIEYALTNQ